MQGKGAELAIKLESASEKEVKRYTSAIRAAPFLARISEGMETIFCRPPQGRQPQNNLRPHFGPDQKVPNRKEDREKDKVWKLGFSSLPRFAARMTLEEEEEQ